MVINQNCISLDAGKTVYNSNPKMNELMEQAAKALNIKVIESIDSKIDLLTDSLSTYLPI